MRALLCVFALAAVVASTAAGAEAPPETLVPGQLTVGVSLPSEGFQVGAVSGASVVVARGLEIDLARALATRLGLAKVAFVQSRFDRLYSGGTKPFDVAIAQISITDPRKLTTDFTRPYMTVDQGVLASQVLPQTPKTIADLRPLQLCALAKSTGADVARDRIKPVKPVRLVGNVPTMMLDLQTGKCSAVVYDAPALGTLKNRAPLRFGAFVGVIPTREAYGIAIPRGTGLLSPVDQALGALIAGGTIQRLQRKWLAANLEKLPTLR